MQPRPLVSIKKNTKGKLILFLVLMLPGLALLLWGLVEFAGELSFNLGSQKVEGKIVATTYFTGYSKSKSAAFLVTPVVEYKVGDKSYQAKGTYFTNSSEVKIGTTLNVWYNPNDPAEARIDNFRSDYINVVPLVVLGLAEIGFVIMFYIIIRVVRKPITPALEAKKRIRSRL